MPDPKKQRAGRKGGQAVSKDRAHMAAIGRKGGQRSRVKRAEQPEQKPEQKQEPLTAQVAGSDGTSGRRPEQSQGPEHSRQHGSSDHPLEMLKADHRRVNSLFEDYETAGGEDKIAIAERIMKELQIHAAIEEEIFYPAFKDKAGAEGHDLVSEALEEHQSVKTAIQELRTMDPDEEAFESTFHGMIHDVQHHVGEEEGEMFPLAEEVLADRLEELGTEMERRKHDLMESITTEALH